LREEACPERASLDADCQFSRQSQLTTPYCVQVIDAAVHWAERIMQKIDNEIDTSEQCANLMLAKAIDYYVMRLRAAGGLNVDAYEKTVRNNSGNASQVLNFLSEAITALMFLEHGDVLMRDKPDLFVTLRGESFYAEVKHFNRKEQDDLDEQAERNAPEFELVRVGDTVPKEGKTPWRQIAEVAISKESCYIKGAINVLVIHSDSDALYGMCESGANEFSDDMKSTPPDSPLRRLNGIMLINCLMGSRGGPSNVEFAVTKYPWQQMSFRLFQALAEIRTG